VWYDGIMSESIKGKRGSAMQVGDLVKTKLQDVDIESNWHNHSGPISTPVCPLGVIVEKEEMFADHSNPILTVRLVPEGYTNVYFQSDLEVVSNG
jgi:hypothetical protein